MNPAVIYNNAAVKLEHRLDLEGNKDTQYLSLNCELWGVYHENYKGKITML